MCEGFGKTMDIAEALVVPQPWLSVFDGAVAPWRGPASMHWKNEFIHRQRQTISHAQTENSMGAEENKIILFAFSL